MSDDKVLQTTLKVSVKGVEYEFRIPSLADEIKLSMHERKIRAKLDPDGNGSPDGLDRMATLMVRSAAIFEVLLESAGAKWPYSDDPKGAPKIDFEKWPTDKVGEAVAVGLEFENALARFRNPGVADPNAAGTEAVASGQDPGASQPVQPGSA